MRKLFRKITLISFITIILTGCASKHYIQTTPYRSYFSIINQAYLKKVGDLTKIASRDNFVLYEGLDLPTSQGNRYKRIILEITTDDKSEYYLFGEFAKYENGQIVIYSPSFLYSSDDPDNNSGVWLEAEFYDENGRTGVKFKYDSKPENYQDIEVNEEGVFLYKNGTLERLCEFQTADCFNLKRINGLYFIPSPGTFYRKFDFEDINRETKMDND